MPKILGIEAKNAINTTKLSKFNKSLNTALNHSLRKQDKE